MDAYETKDEGITVRKMLSIIIKRKVLFIAITLSITLILILSVLFINPNRERINFQFTMDFPSIENNMTMSGDPFIFTDIISLSRIQEVIDSDDRFASLDANQILGTETGQPLIQIEKAINQPNYTITLVPRGFGGIENSRIFVSELLSNTLAFIMVAPDKEIVINPLNDLLNDETLGFGYFIDVFNSLLDQIMFRYHFFIEERPFFRLVGSEYTVSQHRTQLNNFLTNNPIEALQETILVSPFIRSEAHRDTLITEAAQLQLLIEQTQLQIDDLVAILEQLPENSAIIIEIINELILENLTLNLRLRSIENLVSNGIIPQRNNDSEQDNFLDELDEIIYTLTTQISLINQYYVAFANINTRLNFISTPLGTTTNTISIWLTAIGGLVLGALVSLLTVLIVDKFANSPTAPDEVNE